MLSGYFGSVVKLPVACPFGNPPGGRPASAVISLCGHPIDQRNMAHIRYTNPDEAGPELAKLQQRYSDARGNLDNILRIHSLDPPSMEHHHDLYRHLMTSPSPLSRRQREMIAVAVSAANDCYY